MDIAFKDSGFVKLSVQRALLGNVTSNLAGVHAERKDRRVVLSAYFFDEPSEDDREHIEDAATEGIADFLDGHVVETVFGLYSESAMDRPGWCFLRAKVQSAKSIQTRRL
jgi:hypothetical protein